MLILPSEEHNDNSFAQDAQQHGYLQLLAAGVELYEYPNLVPGDVVLLAAGSLVPADARALEAADCHVSEAVLTGESFPVQKHQRVAEAATPLAKRDNSVFLGTNVRSGTARCLVDA